MMRKPWMLSIIVLMLALTACSGKASNQTANNAVPPAEDAAHAPAENAAEQSPPSQNAEPTKEEPVQEEESNEPVKLVIASYQFGDTLKAAIKKYEGLHPNVDIELQTASMSGKNLNEVVENMEKFIASTNTSMLSGKGPDLIEMDVLPKDKYISHRLLANLDDLMKSDASFQSDHYFMSLLDRMRTDEGLYGMPLRFSLIGLLGDKSVNEQAGVQVDDSNWDTNDFIAAAKQLKQDGRFPFAYSSTPGEVLEKLVAENYSRLVSGANGNMMFDASQFAAILQQAKQLFDEGIIQDTTGQAVGPGSGGPSFIQDSYFQDVRIDSLQDYLLYNAYQNPYLFAKPHPAGAPAGGYFKPKGTIGIAESSAHKKEAWKFLKFLLEDEGVESGDASSDTISAGLPLNKNIFNKQIEDLKNKGSLKRWDDKVINVNTEALNQLKSYIDDATNPVYEQSKVNEIMFNESKSYFAGQKSADQVAKLVKSKMDLLLNE